jgi:hypothetical protein
LVTDVFEAPTVPLVPVPTAEVPLVPVAVLIPFAVEFVPLVFVPLVFAPVVSAPVPPVLPPITPGEVTMTSLPAAPLGASVPVALFGAPGVPLVLPAPFAEVPLFTAAPAPLVAPAVPFGLFVPVLLLPAVVPPAPTIVALAPAAPPVPFAPFTPGAPGVAAAPFAPVNPMLLWFAPLSRELPAVALLGFCSGAWSPLPCARSTGGTVAVRLPLVPYITGRWVSSAQPRTPTARTADANAAHVDELIFLVSNFFMLHLVSWCCVGRIDH